jgi:iron complex outermembrane receptor protein
MHDGKRRLASTCSRLALTSTLAIAALAAGAVAATAQTARPIQLAAAAQSTATVVDTTDAVSTAQVQEIVVTARLRAEDIQKVPEAINYLGAQQLQEQQITSYQGLEGFVPNLQIQTSYRNDNAPIFLRNYAAVEYFAEVPAPAVGGYMSSLYDMGSVQVLEGPQGTLFGTTALGGAVLFTPNRPNLSKFGAGFDLMGGNLGLNNESGFVNLPLIPDHVALRMAGAHQHTDGYTRMISFSGKLDEIENGSVRASLEVKPFGGRFDNYTMFEYYEDDETPTSRFASAYNPMIAFYNLNPAAPYSFNGVTAATTTPASYKATCTTSAADGYFPNTPAGIVACENQRIGILTNVFASVTQEIALQRAGAVRTELQDLYPQQPLLNKSNNINFTNITTFDLVRSPSLDISLKNIFWYYQYRDITTTWTAANNFDYFVSGGDQVLMPLAMKPGVIGDGFGIPSLGPYNHEYSDEFQVHGAFDHDLVVWVLGVYGIGVPIAPNTFSPNNLNLTYGGANTVAENPAYAGNFNLGSWTGNWGEYMQATFDLRWLLKGLHFTAGIRENENYTRSTTAPVVYNFIADTAAPGTPNAPVIAKSTGLNWTFSVDYQVNDSLMVYFSNRRAFVAGGINTQVAAVQGLPGYTPTFQPETLLDYEIGAKYNFNFGDTHGFIDVDAYRSNFTNIFVALQAYTAAGGFVGYTENAAAAVKEGVEFQADVYPIPNLEIYASVAYASDYYTTFQDSDPLGLVTHYDATNPLCLAAPNGVPAGQTPTTCILDLSKNPFNYSPTWMGSLRIRYSIPLGERVGTLTPSVTVNGQTREWFPTFAAREIQGLGPQLGPGLQLGARTIVNARLQWSQVLGSKASAAFFVNNLFDTLYARGGIDALVGIGVANVNYAPPRIFGFELSDKF